jgi:acylphosphatase
MIIVHGKVQGVSFRKHIEDLAISLNVNGYVKNLEEGNVEIVAEGEDEDIEEVINFCKVGPNDAEVNEVDVIEEEFNDEFDEFEIKY